MTLTQYESKNNTLYINSNAILPNTKGLPFKEHCKKYDEAFSKSYLERIEAYASEDNKKIILHVISEHPGCTISEFCGA